ncbi:MAG: Methionine aminopeptidase 1 [bacterium ADurb.Bin400]|nr:MAG: Methionine aminopeptidase 1 [bacterium ADurb.Bin400]
MENILNKEQIINIKACGQILKRAMDITESSIRPGMSTHEINTIADQALSSQGAIAAFKNYQTADGGVFPASACISINEQVVHGLPDKNTFIKSGDIISIDLGALFKGVYTDMARTIPVGEVSSEARKLIEITRQSLNRGIKAARAGSRIGKIGYEVQKLAESEGYGVVRELVGHGIGTKMHMDPQIPNYGRGNEGPVIVEGMALAIEPMLTLGNPNVKMAKDGWTIITADKSLSAHFEHTIVIENGLPIVVTK